VLDFKNGLIFEVNLVKAVFVVGAFELDELHGLGKAGVLSNDYVGIGQLVRRVELVLENLSEHDALVKSLDLQAKFAELMREDAAVHLLDVSESVLGFDVVVLRNALHAGSCNRIVVL
jgi:hypothetical protein